jgi:hypothetical protein
MSGLKSTSSDRIGGSVYRGSDSGRVYRFDQLLDAHTPLLRPSPWPCTHCKQRYYKHEQNEPLAKLCCRCRVKLRLGCS